MRFERRYTAQTTVIVMVVTVNVWSREVAEQSPPDAMAPIPFCIVIVPDITSSENRFGRDVTAPVKAAVVV